nr:PREDICTED: uncharacterized protein LOC109031454 [Bemisia tabaci]
MGSSIKHLIVFNRSTSPIELLNESLLFACTSTTALSSPQLSIFLFAKNETEENFHYCWITEFEKQMPDEYSLIPSKSHECSVLEGSAVMAQTSRRVLASLTAMLGARPYVIWCVMMPCSWIILQQLKHSQELLTSQKTGPTELKSQIHPGSLLRSEYGLFVLAFGQEQLQQRFAHTQYRSLCNYAVVEESYYSDISISTNASLSTHEAHKVSVDLKPVQMKLPLQSESKSDEESTPPISDDNHRNMDIDDKEKDAKAECRWLQRGPRL